MANSRCVDFAYVRGRAVTSGGTQPTVKSRFTVTSKWYSSTGFRNVVPSKERAEFLKQHLPSRFLSKEKVVGAG